MKQDIRQIEFEGLCMTCDHAGSCGYVARTEGPIWRCEEFDDSGPITTRIAAAAERRTPWQATDSLRDGSGGTQGLCCNCDNQPVCGLHGAGEDVWYCEEYR